MYGIKKPEELQIKKRWSENEAFRSLAVPVGLGENGECVELNFYETSHGPHGLIVGTTGSGKTEFLQSYIASLAINFHPYEVGFLLIDYCGNGIAHLFNGIPHVLGTLINLDEEYIHFITSIRGELRRRQDILSDYDVNHISKYIKLYKEGKAKVPLPFLFLICDEFYAIKEVFPEFLEMLLETSRIGRSLGIHLILTTGKPSVVDDIIWSNCKCKICFKVQDENASRDILKTPDAAYITNVGQAFLQVGKNEIYERFQAGWSGVVYNENTEKKQDKMAKTQLDTIVQHIIQVYGEEQTFDMRIKWLPQLPNIMVSPYSKNVENNNIDILDATLGIGMVEKYYENVRQEYKVDFVKKGHILYAASEGYGKSTFLGNLIIGLAMKNTVHNLKFIIIDMGDYALEPYRKLSHVEDYFCFRDIERFEMLKKNLIDIMDERKRQFKEIKADNFSSYNQNRKDKLPAIFIMVDNYERISEFGDNMVAFIKKIALEGEALGLYLAVTISKSNTMGYSTLVNFRERIVGFNFQEEETKNLIGRSHICLSEQKKGRALVKLDEISLMQLYTPVPCQNDIIYKNELEKLIDKINKNNLSES